MNKKGDVDFVVKLVLLVIAIIITYGVIMFFSGKGNVILDLFRGMSLG